MHNFAASDHLPGDQKPSICVFDIGGTWFRSGLFTANGTIHDICCIPSISYHNFPERTISDLQSDLVAYLCAEVERMTAAHPTVTRAAISMGAALNAHTGFIFNSGPLWGPDCIPFDLAARLRSAAPDFEWMIVNDVTAALACHVTQSAYRGNDRLALMTVSTGVALRTYDRRSDSFPVDPLYGIQGEIGHLPIAFEFRGDRICQLCDCGGQDHLNAFCSGRGLENLAREISERYPGEFDGLLGDDGKLEAGIFADRIAKNDTPALELLAAATVPIADSILRLLTIDPEIEKVILSGGVCESLGEVYRQHVLAHLSKIGSYIIAATDPGYYAGRIVLGEHNGEAGLIGAGLLSRAHERSGNAGTRTLSATRTVSFDVNFTTAILDPANDTLAGLLTSPAGAVLIVDQAVERIFGAALRSYLASVGMAPHLLVLACSEQTKTPQLVEHVVRWLNGVQIQRRTHVIAIGGGVLLDIVGMAAGQYRRGIPYVRIPTTLLAMVDASVGGKVGVNFERCKSRLGLYYPPARVDVDKAFLTSLPLRELRNGAAEIVKVALMLDSELFSIVEIAGAGLIEERFRSPEGDDVIRRAVALMIEQLEPNLWELDLDRRVDFGHSFSPALEMAEGSGLLHGEAVAIDMVLSCTIALNREMIDPQTWRRIVSVIDVLGLPLTHPLATPDFLWHALQDTVLHRDGKQRLPMPTGIGRAVFCNDITFTEVERACQATAGLREQRERA